MSATGVRGVTVIGTARIVCGTGIMILLGVCLSVCLSVPLLARSCGGFAAERLLAEDIDRQQRPPVCAQHQQQTALSSNASSVTLTADA